MLATSSLLTNEATSECRRCKICNIINSMEKMGTGSAIPIFPVSLHKMVFRVFLVELKSD